MLYLIDANVLITAHDQYYPLDVVPEFWGWLRHQGRLGVIKMAIENYEEIEDGKPTRGTDPLYDWAQEPESKDALLLNTEVDGDLVVRVLHEGYAPDLTDDQIDQLGRDPFLIAHALADPANRCVVTTETSKPRLQAQNRRIPDACTRAGVNCHHTFQMLRLLRFSTRWRP
ncbi:MAG TPA: DUF4411 family protein [Geminicoccus sp.]|jgi:hypothetical protein|uniref:DUF4411 family protein n=1 Tax=Geminicoccus sp. TaxID=2024832 RepID=UPI002E377148|nr:DUF4411 family protein [Geminicoccus sp.]HEX2526768.1 DUF4411 family protein [Geminicoccus sp.]